MADRSTNKAKKLLELTSSGKTTVDNFRDALWEEYEEALKQMALLNEIQSHLMRSDWGECLKKLLYLAVVFQIVLVVVVGLGFLKFTGYENFLNIVGGSLFIEIVGLCAIIVKCIFAPPSR